MRQTPGVSDLSSLVLTVSDKEADDTCRMSVSVSSGGFTGRGYAWFNVSLLLEFARALAELPLSTANPPRLSGGYGDFEGRPSEEHVGLEARQVDDVGHVVVTVHVAGPPDVRRPAELNEVTVNYPTGYQELADFSRGLRQCLSTGEGTANLVGNALP